MASLQEILRTQEVSYELIRSRSSSESLEEAALTSALSRLAIKERRIRDAYENEIDTLEEYKANKLRLQAEREQIEADLARFHRHSPAELPDPDACKAALLRKIADVYDHLSDPDADNTEKAGYLRQIVKKIVFDRQSGEFRFFYYFSI